MAGDAAGVRCLADGSQPVPAMAGRRRLRGPARRGDRRGRETRRHLARGRWQLKGISAAGTGTKKDPKYVALQVVIDKTNDLFGAASFAESQVREFVQGLLQRLLAAPNLINQTKVNSKKQFMESRDFAEAVREAVADNRVREAVADNQDAHNTMADYFFTDGPAIDSIIVALADAFYEAAVDQQADFLDLILFAVNWAKLAALIPSCRDPTSPPDSSSPPALPRKAAASGSTKCGPPNRGVLLGGDVPDSQWEANCPQTRPRSASHATMGGHGSDAAGAV